MKFKNLNRVLDRTIFSVKSVDDKRIVHFYGYGLDSENDYDENPYGFLEYVGACTTLDDIIENGFAETERVVSEDKTQYITDYSKSGLLEVINTYDNGKTPTAISEITADISDGCYIYIN